MKNRMKYTDEPMGEPPILLATALRDAMLLASGAHTTPQDKAREARAMADFLEAAAPADSVLAKVVPSNHINTWRSWMRIRGIIGSVGPALPTGWQG